MNNLIKNENIDSLKFERVKILDLKKVANTYYIKVKFFKNILNEDYQKNVIVHEDSSKDLVYDNDTIFDYEPNFEGYLLDKSRPIKLYKLSKNVKISFNIESWEVTEISSFNEISSNNEKLNLIKKDKFLYFKQLIPGIFDINTNLLTNEVVEIFEDFVP